MMKYFSVYIP